MTTIQEKKTETTIVRYLFLPRAQMLRMQQMKIKSWQDTSCPNSITDTKNIGLALVTAGIYHVSELSKRYLMSVTSINHARLFFFSTKMSIFVSVCSPIREDPLGADENRRTVFDTDKLLAE